MSMNDYLILLIIISLLAGVFIFNVENIYLFVYRCKYGDLVEACRLLYLSEPELDSDLGDDYDGVHKLVFNYRNFSAAVDIHPTSPQDSRITSYSINGKIRTVNENSKTEAELSVIPEDAWQKGMRYLNDVNYIKKEDWAGR